MKYIFSVPDMSCEHCKSHIDKAIKNWGKAQAWLINLDTKQVTVESNETSDAVAKVIQEAGYTPHLE
jgi:copper chaperone